MKAEPLKATSLKDVDENIEKEQAKEYPDITKEKAEDRARDMASEMVKDD